MLSFMTTTLETFGYRVIEATDGERGDRPVSPSTRTRSVSSSADVVMPGMSGAELQSGLRAAAPTCPFCS